MISSPSLFLFDLDGTLVQCYYDDDHSYFNAFKRLLGISEMPTLNHSNPHLTDSYYFDALFKHLKNELPSKAQLAKMLDYFEEELHANSIKNPQHYLEITGARSFMSDLKSSNKSVGVASGGWERMIDFKLNKIGVLEYVDAYKGSDEHTTKAGFTHALRQKLDPSLTQSCIYFGDSLYDYGQMQELNIPFVGVDFKQTGRFNDLDCPVIPHFNNRTAVQNAIAAYFDQPAS